MERLLYIPPPGYLVDVVPEFFHIALSLNIFFIMLNIRR
jgi:hypothetical protein